MPITYQWTSHCALTRCARSFKSWSWASKDCSFFWTSKSFSGLILEEWRVIEKTGKPQKCSPIFSKRPTKTYLLFIEEIFLHLRNIVLLWTIYSWNHIRHADYSLKINNGSNKKLQLHPFTQKTIWTERENHSSKIKPQN